MAQKYEEFPKLSNFDAFFWQITSQNLRTFAAEFKTTV